MTLSVAARLIECCGGLKGLTLPVRFNIEWQREASVIHRVLAASSLAQRLTTHSTGARVNLAFMRETWLYRRFVAPGQFGR
jgi:hypothetical protein